MNRARLPYWAGVLAGPGRTAEQPPEPGAGASHLYSSPARPAPGCKHSLDHLGDPQVRDCQFELADLQEGLLRWLGWPSGVRRLIG